MSFSVHETHLPARLGLNHHEVRAWRSRLQEGVDFTIEKKGRVYWSEAAVSRVRQLVETGAETPAGRFGLSDAADVVKTPPEEVCNDLPVLPPAPIETLRVVQAQFPNPYVVKAALESGEEVFVRVKSAKNFRKTITDGSPMLLKAKKEAGQWVLDGPLPRWPGKW